MKAGARYCAHLDVPRLLAFAHKVESDPEIFRQLNLQANPCAFERGGRVYLRELNPLRSNGSAVKTASPEGNEDGVRALETARAPVDYETLSRSPGRFCEGK